MKPLNAFLRHYKLFGLALLAIIVSLMLKSLDYTTASHWVLAIVSLIAVLPLLWDMVQDVRAGAYGIDILAITAIVVSVVLKQYWAAIVVVVMLTGGEALEDYAERRAKVALDALLKHAPRTATLLRKGKPVAVDVDKLSVRDLIQIKPGEVVAVDAIITEGTSSFDESSLTGESLPQTKQAGDTILSGSVNIDGAITARATASAEDSQYQQVIKLVRNAAASHAPFVRLAERYSLPFTFTAFAIASAVWALSGQAIRFLEVIVVATPCPLLLAAPIALISGMSRASRYGIIVKTGGSLERLAEAQTIVFDKTGTLTRGQLSVAKVAAYNDFSQQEVLQLAASLEQNSHHVAATALVTAATDKALKLSKAKHVKEAAGQGVQGSLKGRQITAGRLSYLEANGVTLPSNAKATELKQTAVFVGVDQTLAGVITLQDEIRPESGDTLERLRRNGLKHFMMVTGDNQSAAKTVGQTLGISKITSNALPADKLHAIAKVKDGPLVFVGDGVNDAPVLTAADVGIALGARGSTAASESADMVIMLDDISYVATAHGIARRTFRIARQSIFIGMLLSLALMGIFATGKLSPLTGAIAQEVVDVFVIINALRARS